MRFLRSARIATPLIALFAIFAFAATSAQAQSAWWGVSSVARPSNLEPGGKATIVALATNIGDASASGPIVITDTLPPGVSPKSATSVSFYSTAYYQRQTAGTFASEPYKDLGPEGPLAARELCSVSVSQRRVTCTLPAPESTPGYQFRSALPYSGRLELRIAVRVAEEGFELQSRNEVSVSSATASRSIARPLTISEAPTTFGAQDYELRPEEAGGALDVRAGSHPFQLSSFFALNQTAETAEGALPAALPRDLSFPLPAGLIGNVAARPTCTAAQFLTQVDYRGEEGTLNIGIGCPPQTAIGVTTTVVNAPGSGGLQTFVSPIFNLTPAYGEPARFGFLVGVVRVILDSALRSPGDYGITVSTSNITQLAGTLSSEVTFWGTPGDPAHDASRGYQCLDGGTCASADEPHPNPLLTLPTSCPGTPFAASTEDRSWAEPAEGSHPGATYTLHEELGGPPLALEACNRLSFSPTLQAAPTTDSASSPTGLDVNLDFHDEGLLNPEGLAQSQLNKTVVKLPEGVTINPSAGVGLGSCSEADYARETIQSPPGAGCPNDSKLGTVEVQTPLLTQKIEGSIFIAQPYRKPVSNGHPASWRCISSRGTPKRGS